MRLASGVAPGTGRIAPILQLPFHPAEERLPMSSMTTQRYDRVATLLHWFLAAFLLGQVAFGWLLDEFERGTPAKAMAVNLHKSSGLVLALLILVRLLWRLRHAPPAYPSRLSARQVLAIRGGHALLYICMLALPLTGYLASNFSRHGIKFLNVYPMPPWGADDKAIYGLLNGAHDAFALLFTLLIAGHVALSLYHSFVARDGLGGRMSLSP